MSRLPPTERFSLACRKNLRDDWECRKDHLQTKLSELLGTPWTIDIDPPAIYPYAKTGDYAHQRPGSCIYAYVDGALWQLGTFVQHNGAEDLNSICHAHALTLDVDLARRVHYCGSDIDDAGRLRILFHPDCMGTNASAALAQDAISKLLNDAPPPPGGSGSALSFAARTGIRREFEPHIAEIAAQVQQTLQNTSIKFDPNFEVVYAALRAAAAEVKNKTKKQESGPGDEWDASMGNLVKLYFEGLASQLRWQKFDEDDLLREGFAEAVEFGVVKVRVVEKLRKRTYCEAVVEDGVLYLQTTPQYFGTNVTDAAEGLVDIL